MPSLLEAVATLAVSASVTSLVCGALGSQAALQAQSAAHAADFFAARQLEQLADRVTLSAGAGPAHPSPVTSLDAADVVLGADLDGDGVVSTSGSETTALEVRQDGRTAKVRLRLGRQTMTVLEAEDSEAALAARDRRGFPATAATATLVELTLTDRGDGELRRRLLFSLPQRAFP